MGHDFTIRKYAIFLDLTLVFRGDYSLVLIAHKIYVNSQFLGRQGKIFFDSSTSQNHFPIFMISQNNVSLPKQVNNKFKMQRKETEQNINCFKADLSEEEWQNVYIESDVNKAYEHFINKLLYYYNKNIPLNKIK